MAVLTVTTLVATSGTMKVEQAAPQVYKVMRHGSVDAYLGHLSENEVRDLFDVLGDLITYIDTAQPAKAEHGTVEGFNSSCRCAACIDAWRSQKTVSEVA